MLILGENAVLSTLIIPLASVIDETYSPETSVSLASSALIAEVIFAGVAYIESVLPLI